MCFEIPKNVADVLSVLNNAGFEAYIVGGCVRDMLRGVNPHDYDVTSAAPPETVKKLFPHTADTGIKHGTVTVISNGEPVEVTTFRTESGYADHRRPDNVSFVGNVALDLARRDFTVNAICLNLSGDIIDPFDGAGDIRRKLLRTVGEPDARFSEDALRILRLFRFACVLEFNIEPETLDAAYRNAPLLSGISRERIASELRKASCGGNFTELRSFFKNSSLGFAGIIREFPKGTERLSLKPDLRLFALLYGASDDISETSAFLRLSKRESGYIENMSAAVSGGVPNTRADIKRLLCKFGENVVRDFLQYENIVIGTDTSYASRELDSILASGEAYRICDLCINGNEIRKLNIAPEKTGNILNSLLETVIDDPSFNNRELLIKLAEKLSN